MIMSIKSLNKFSLRFISHVLEVENIQGRDQGHNHEENQETGAQFHILIDIEILGQDQMRDIDILCVSSSFSY
jgi:hypothetical protein